MHRLILNVLKNSINGYWKTNRLLVEHAIQLEHKRFPDLLSAENLHDSWNINKLAVLWYQEGDYLRAEQLNRLALSRKESKVGPDHESSLWLLIVVATSALYKTTEAERNFQQILKISEKMQVSDALLFHDTVGDFGFIL